MQSLNDNHHQSFQTLRDNDVLCIVYKDFEKIEFERVGSPRIIGADNPKRTSWTLDYISTNALESVSVDGFRDSHITISNWLDLGHVILYNSGNDGYFRYDMNKFGSGAEGTRKYEDVIAIFICGDGFTDHRLAYIYHECQKKINEGLCSLKKELSEMTSLRERVSGMKLDPKMGKYPNARNEGEIKEGSTIAFIPYDIADGYHFYKIIRKNDSVVIGMEYGGDPDDMSSYVFLDYNIVILDDNTSIARLELMSGGIKAGLYEQNHGTSSECVSMDGTRRPYPENGVNGRYVLKTGNDSIKKLFDSEKKERLVKIDKRIYDLRKMNDDNGKRLDIMYRNQRDALKKIDELTGLNTIQK